MSKQGCVPEGFHSVTPHMVVKDAAQAIEFYRRAFGATEMFRNTMPGSDTVMHAQLRIGDSPVMLNDEFPDQGVVAPAAGAAGVTIHLYTTDADQLFEQAVQAGAQVIMPLQDTFWGDRYALVADAFGHRWGIATCLEKLAPHEIAARAQQAFGQGSQPAC